jgi:glutamate-1-semialdehyde 2,1-aminomutase
MTNRTKSIETYRKLCEVIPGGVNSPVRACCGNEQAPLVADHASRDLVVDVDGNVYIDYCGSWGALIHGAANKEILEAAAMRMQKGTTFGMTTAIEEKLARKITEIIPSVEKIRFVSTGTEATMSAVRLARGFTGRPLIIKFAGNYHGHADFFLVKAGSGVSDLHESTSAGIPDDLVKHTLCLNFNDCNGVKEVFNNPEFKDKIAAVILEPIAGNMGLVPASYEFIKLLECETKKHGALLIFDEVMTGFRVALKGAQSLYNVKPDLTCFAKIIGGGFPAAAFGGREDIMNCLAPLGSVYQAGTLSGNPVAMEAGLKAITLLEAPGFYEELLRKTNIITEPVREYFRVNNILACIQQAGSMFTLFFGIKQATDMDTAKSADNNQFKRFFSFMFANGVYIPPLQMEAWFVSSAHTDEHLEKTRDLILQFFWIESKN